MKRRGFFGAIAAAVVTTIAARFAKADEVPPYRLMKLSSSCPGVTWGKAPNQFYINKYYPVIRQGVDADGALKVWMETATYIVPIGIIEARR